MLLLIGMMFISTVLYASGLKDPGTRTIFLYMSLVFPAVLALSLSFSVPSLSYFELDQKGIHITVLGIIHKHIYWSDIESICSAAMNGTEFIGIIYKSSYNRRKIGRKIRNRTTGWDEVVSNAHAKNGASLYDEATKRFKEYSSANSLRTTNTRQTYA